MLMASSADQDLDKCKSTVFEKKKFKLKCFAVQSRNNLKKLVISNNSIGNIKRKFKIIVTGYEQKPIRHINNCHVKNNQNLLKQINIVFHCHLKKLFYLLEYQGEID